MRQAPRKCTRRAAALSGEARHATLTIRIDFGAFGYLGPGKIALMELISKHGSISAAGKEMGMSYRRAWLLVDEINHIFRAPLVETQMGGAGGGGRGSASSATTSSGATAPSRAPRPPRPLRISAPSWRCCGAGHGSLGMSATRSRPPPSCRHASPASAGGPAAARCRGPLRLRRSRATLLTSANTGVPGARPRRSTE